MIKCTRTEPKFKVDFLENKASNEKFVFYIFNFFFRVESPPLRLYHRLPITLYIRVYNRLKKLSVQYIIGYYSYSRNKASWRKISRVPNRKIINFYKEIKMLNMILLPNWRPAITYQLLQKTLYLGHFIYLFIILHITCIPCNFSPPNFP